MRRARHGLWLALLALGCSSPGVQSEQTPEEAKAVVRGYMEEVLNARSWDRWDVYFPESVRFNETDISKETVKTMSAALRSAIPDLRLTIEDQIAEGDRVVTRVVFRGTHLGELNGIPPTGRSIEYAGIAIDRIVDGKVVEMWHVANPADGLARPAR